MVFKVASVDSFLGLHFAQSSRRVPMRITGVRSLTLVT